jgi:hypothetical protein
MNLKDTSLRSWVTYDDKECDTLFRSYYPMGMAIYLKNVMIIISTLWIRPEWTISSYLTLTRSLDIKLETLHLYRLHLTKHAIARIVMWATVDWFSNYLPTLVFSQCAKRMSVNDKLGRLCHKFVVAYFIHPNICLDDFEGPLRLHYQGDKNRWTRKVYRN